MTATYRYAKRAGVLLGQFLEDATSGIAAACGRVNTDREDTLLPTTWNFANHGKGRVVALPIVRYVYLGDESDEPMRRGNQPAWYTFNLVCAIGTGNVGGDGFAPATDEDVSESLAWALREMFMEVEAYHGHTLGGRVRDARLTSLASPGPVQIEQLNNARAIVVGAYVRIGMSELRET